jgi:chromate reductase
MQILAISGSLRTASTNTTLLKAAAALAPEDVSVNVFYGLANLPHFNPDLDKDPPHAAVAEFRFQLGKSAGVIFSSPEYAHGVPGTLKNALDWVVASGELYEKPVALFSASPRAGYAQASLVETLTVMSARIVPEACIVAPLLGKNLDENGVISEADLSRAVRSALRAFARATSIHSDARMRTFLEHEEPVGCERY